MQIYMDELDNLSVVNFTNIDSEDFAGMWGGKETIIKKGETKPYPKFLAEHYAKHLGKKMLIREGKDFGNVKLLEELRLKIIGNVTVNVSEPEIKAPELAPEFEELKETTADINETTTTLPKKRGRQKKV